MTEYDRDEVACHLCFQDRELQDWIKAEGRKGGACPWCGRRGYLIALARLSEPFREVASLYVPVEEGLDAYQRGAFSWMMGGASSRTEFGLMTSRRTLPSPSYMPI